MRLRAERRAGEFLKDIPWRGRGGGDAKSSDIVSPGLSMAGIAITCKPTSRWQREASKIIRTFNRRFFSLYAVEIRIAHKNLPMCCQYWTG